MQKLLISLSAVALGMCLTGVATKAQLGITFTNAPNDTRTVGAGGFTTFNATLANTSTTDILELVGIDVNLHSSDLSWRDGELNNELFFQNFFTPNEFLGTSASRTGGLFQIALSANPSNPIPTNYTGTVGITYLKNGNQGSLVKNFNVQSTPSPPVILVTLFSGIGTLRVACRRRKAP